jgi:hypothetical protein
LNVVKFSIEEDITNPAGVKIFFEGGLAWYEIISAHPSYAVIFRNMQLKARLWLWIQLRRSNALVKRGFKHTSPSLKQLQERLPPHFTSVFPDPIDAFHPYLIERIIQSELSEETEKTLAVGPEGVNPEWFACEAVQDLRVKYFVSTLLSLLTKGYLGVNS